MTKTLQLCYEILHMKSDTAGISHLILHEVRYLLLKLANLRAITKDLKNIKRVFTLFHQFNALHKDFQELLVDGVLLILRLH